MTYLSDLETARDAALAALTAALENPRPNYKIEDQEVYYADYIDMLTSTIDRLSKQIGENATFFKINRFGG